MIRNELYGDYVVIRNEVVIESDSKSVDFNDSRFNIFTKEEREAFEKIYREHMKIIYGNDYGDNVLLYIN